VFSNFLSDFDSKEMVMDSTNELMTIGEVAAMIHVRTSWIYARTAPGSLARERLPYLKLGKLLRFKRSEVLVWLEGQRSGVEPSGRQPDDAAQVAVSARLV
jgi:excisionase family DNA binding protein